MAVNWQDTFWNSTDKDGVARQVNTGISVQWGDPAGTWTFEGAAKQITLRDLTNYVDGTNTIVKNNFEAQTATIHLGTVGRDSIASGAGIHGTGAVGTVDTVYGTGMGTAGGYTGDSVVSGLASSQAVANEFGTIEAQITSQGAVVINSLTLSDRVLTIDTVAAGTGTIADWGAINIESNNISAITGSSKADTLNVGNFGSSGTINLGKGGDRLAFTTQLTDKTIVIDGGVGADSIEANGSNITYKLNNWISGEANTAAGQGIDTVATWAMRNNGVGGVIQLVDGQKFSDTYVLDFVANAGENHFNISSFKTSDSRVLYTSFSTVANAAATHMDTFISDGTVTKSAMIVGTNVAAGALSATVVNATNLYIGSHSLNSAAKTTATANALDFLNSGKTRIYLGHSDGSNAEFGDTSQYINIDSVQGASVGGSWIFNGSSNAVSLAAGGANDSLCGLGDKADTLISAGNQRTFFGTGAGTGADVVENFTFGNQQLVSSDVVIFVNGVDFSKVKASGNLLQVGSSDTDYLALNTTNAGGSQINLNYQSGLGTSDIKTALIDIAGTNTLQFSKDTATTYVGGVTGTDATKLNLGSEAVSIGWSAVTDYDTYGLAEIDGSSTADGSVINGSAEKANTVKGSASAFSAICGGFSGDYADTKADTLVGGGNDSQTTAYFVGKYLGSDEIQNLSSKDVVNFLNTNFTDITGATNTADSLVVYFANGDKVTAKTGSTLANTKDVTFNFLDGHTTWDGTKFTDFVKNA